MDSVPNLLVALLLAPYLTSGTKVHIWSFMTQLLWVQAHGAWTYSFRPVERGLVPV